MRPMHSQPEYNFITFHTADSPILVRLKPPARPSADVIALDSLDHIGFLSEALDATPLAYGGEPQ